MTRLGQAFGIALKAMQSEFFQTRAQEVSHEKLSPLMIAGKSSRESLHKFCVPSLID